MDIIGTPNTLERGINSSKGVKNYEHLYTAGRDGGDHRCGSAPRRFRYLQGDGSPSAAIGLRPPRFIRAAHPEHRQQEKHPALSLETGEFERLYPRGRDAATIIDPDFSAGR